MVRCLIAFAYVLTCTTSLYAQSEQEVRAVAKISVVVTATDQARMYGSGVAIGPDGYILTARHVVGDVDPSRELIYVQFGGPSALRYRAELSECLGADTDACLIHMSPSDLASSNVNSFSPLGCRRLDVSEEIVAMGWPAVEWAELDRVRGEVTSRLGQRSLYQTTVPALPGMSGGPVFDRSGHVVGLVKGALDTNTMSTRILVTPLFRAQALINATPQRCESGYDPAEPAAVQPPPPMPATPAMTFVICEGEYESRCKPYQYDYFVGCYQVDSKIAALCQGRTAQRVSVRPSEGGNRCGYGWVRVSC